MIMMTMISYRKRKLESERRDFKQQEAGTQNQTNASRSRSPDTYIHILLYIYISSYVYVLCVLRQFCFFYNLRVHPPP